MFILSDGSVVGTANGDVIIGTESNGLTLNGGGSGFDIILADFYGILRNGFGTSMATAYDLDSDNSLWFTDAVRANPLVADDSIPNLTAMVEASAGTTVWYRIEIPAEATLTIDVDAATGVVGTDASVDTFVRLFYDNGELLAANDDADPAYGGAGSGGNQDSFLTFTNEEPDPVVYFIQIGQYVDGALGAFTSDADFLVNFSLTEHAATGVATGSDTSTVIYGGYGYDLLSGGAGSDFIEAGLGSDTIYGGDGNDNIRVGTFQIDNPLDQNWAYGEDGDDVILAGAGADTLDGGAGIDTLSYDWSQDHVWINLGSNQATWGWADGDTIANFENVSGSDWDDVISGDSNANVLDGGAGHDQLDGAVGDDRLIGGTGGDTIIGGLGHDTILGGEGNDVIHAGYVGGDVYDGDNTVDAGADDDLVYSGSGADDLDGGTGIDTVSYAYSTSGVTIDLELATYSGGYAEGDLLAGFENVIGSDYADVVTGDGNANVITLGDGADSGTGGDGDDRLLGAAGDDILFGGLGQDSLDGGTGDDDMRGGEDDDTYYVDSSLDTVTEYVDEGTDRVVLSTGGYTLGTYVEDLTVTFAGAISVAGNELANSISIGSGATGGEALGMAGNDTIDASTTTSGIELYGGADSDTLTGGSGNDILDGGTGTDAMTGGSGDDTYYVDSYLDTIIEAVNGGTDTVYYSGAADWTLSDNVENLIDLTAGSYTLTGNASANTIAVTLEDEAHITVRAGGSNDIITASGDALSTAGTASLYGDGGNDTITGFTYSDDTSPSQNYLYGGEGNDTLYGGIGTENWFWGGTGADSIYDRGLANTIYGEDGNDLIYTSIAGSIIDGGADVDTIFILDSTEGVTIDLVAGTGSGGTAEGDSYTNIENVWGTNYADSVTGNDSANYINVGGNADEVWGGAGNDTILGVDGNDILHGGADNDWLSGGNGTNTLVGGTGDDYYYLDSATDIIVEEEGEGNDTVRTWHGTFALVANVENLIITANGTVDLDGNDLANELTATSGTATGTLEGFGGNDTLTASSTVNQVLLYGGAGNDTLTAGAGDDYLYGDDDDDILNGGAGNDYLIGGTGADTMTGGSGDDLYEVDNALDEIVEVDGGGYDRVYLVATITYTMDAFVERGEIAYSGARINGNDDNNVLVAGESGTLAGGLGDDTYYIEPITPASGVTIIEDENGGEDTVHVEESYTLTANVENLVALTALNDTFTGNASNNTIDVTILNGVDVTVRGEGGDDTVSLAMTDDVSISTRVTVFGGADNDTITGISADQATVNNILLGGEGDDVIYAGAGANVQNLLDGSIGNDTFHAADAARTEVDAGAGNDTMYDHGYAALFYGGYDDDTYYISSSGTIYAEYENEGYDHVVTDLATYTLPDWFEQLTLTATGSVTIEGNDLANEILVTSSVTGGTVDGGGGNDTIDASALDRTTALFGGEGNDELTGGAGNDQLYGGTGNDRMTGGAGNDSFYVDSVDDVAIELENGGDDYIVLDAAITYTLPEHVENGYVSVAGGTLIGRDAADYLEGEAGTRLIGGLGDDTYVVFGSDVEIVEDAGEGIDTVLAAADYVLGANLENLQVQFFHFGDFTLTGNSLANTITGSRGADTLHGMAGDDILDGGTGDDVLYGGSGNDYFYDYSGTNTCYGGEDDDIYVGYSMTIVEYENEGIDTYYAWGSVVTLTANVENLFYNIDNSVDGTGNELDNLITVEFATYGTLDGAAGDDTLDAAGGTGSFSIYGGTGDDTIFGTAQDDILDGGADHDTANYIYASAGVQVSLLLMGAGQDTLGAGTDTLVGIENLTGSAFDDTLTGNAFSNVLAGGAGDDVLDGSYGRDTASYADAAAGVTVSLQLQGSAQDTLGDGTDTLRDFENLIGSAHADTLTGSGLVNDLAGGAGDDTLTGLAGGDYLHGEAGSDLLIGGNGFDMLYGGDDGDELRGGKGNDALDGGNGDDKLYGNDGADTLTGGLGLDVLVGGTGSDNLAGGDGNDALYGSAGGDSLAGGEGTDWLDGGGGADTLVGGAGDDRFYGSFGKDTMTGGTGADTYFFGNVLESGSRAGGADIITDFSQADGDLIDLTEMALIAFVGTNAFGGSANEVRYYFDGTGDTIVEFDQDGDAVGDMAIRLTGEIALTESDFAATGSPMEPLGKSGADAPTVLAAPPLFHDLSSDSAGLFF